MSRIITMPLINVNDDTANLVKWHIEEGRRVECGAILCSIETSKSNVDVEAEVDGYLRQLVQVGANYAVGHPIAYIARTEQEQVPEFETPISNNKKMVSPTLASKDDRARWTKKAEIIAKQNGIDIMAVSQQFPGRIVGEADVMMVVAKIEQPARVENSASVQTNETLVPNRVQNFERVLILGGGGGCELVLDILSRVTGQKAVAILDNSPCLHSQTRFGVPILGGFELVEDLWKRRSFDTLISTIVKSVNDRFDIFEKFTSMGIPFANIIDPDVRVGQDVQLGMGNIIVFGGYIAVGAHLGNNNFFAAGCNIEHHSIIGDHCTFGPRTTLSGRVTVGSRVKFGMNVSVEPFVEVGSESIIASGITLTTHVPEKSIVKNKSLNTVKPK